jgi:hypothetical protein
VAGEEVVGSIVGFLRLDADEFHREITKALAEIKLLSSTDAKVKVKVDNAPSVERDLTRVSRAAQGVGRDFDKMGGSFRGGGMMSGPVIVGGIAAAMALLGPVTGAATAAMGGFVGVAGTAALAFVGFKHEIEQGTALGQVLQGQLDGIKSEFSDLGATAASAMSGDVLKGLSEIRRFLPTINPEVEALAGHLGRAFDTSAKGVVSGLQAMMPLLEDGGRYAEVLANKFADFTASQDFKDFVEYARRELPNVGSAIVSLAGGFKDLAVALAPVGDDLIEIIHVTGEAASTIAPVVSITSKLARVAAIGANPLQFLAHGLQQSRDAANEATPAIDEHTSHLLTLQSVQSPLASALGTTDAALNAVREAHQKSADAAANATLQMQYEGDAAGLLKQALDKLNGKALSVAETQNAFDSALANSNKHIAANGKTIDRATTSLAGNSAAAVANRGELIRQVKAAEDAATAYRDNGHSADETSAKMKAMRDQIIKNAHAHGLDEKAVKAFIDQIYKIPTKIPPTKLEVEKATAMAGIAAFQKAIDTLHGKRVEVGVHYAYTGVLPNGGHSQHGGTTMDAGATGGLIDNGIRKFSGGGLLTGPGTGTSDSILAAIAGTKEMIRVANGEFISTAASQRRNRAALEAGNRGAQLAVAGQGGGQPIVNHWHLSQTDPYAIAREQARIADMAGV